jgi:hypothetical protein
MADWRATNIMMNGVQVTKETSALTAEDLAFKAKIKAAIAEAQITEADIVYGFLVWMTFGPHCINSGRPWWPVVIHDSKVRLIWEFAGLILMIFEVLTIPYRLVLVVEPTGPWLILELVTLAYFWTDIFSNFFLSFNVGEHRKELRPSRIILQYIKGWMIIDILASFPFKMIFASMSFARVLRLMRFVRYLRILRLMKALKLKQKLLMLEQSAGDFRVVIVVVKIMNVFLILVFLSHYSACLWYLMGSFGLPEGLPAICYDEPWNCPEDGVTWLSTGVQLDEGVEGDELKFQLYVNSLYWALETMTCVGYGDFKPNSSREKVFAVIFFTVSVTIFSGVINSLQQVFLQLFSKEMERRESMRKMVVWTKWRGIKGPIKSRLRAYLNFIYEEDPITHKQRMSTAIVDNVFAKCSTALCKELCGYVYGEHLKPAPYLKWIQPYDLAFHSLCSTCVCNVYAPGDVVCVAQEKAQGFLSLMEGMLMLYQVSACNVTPGRVNPRSHHNNGYMIENCRRSVFDLSKFKRQEGGKGAKQKKNSQEIALMESIEERLNQKVPLPQGSTIVQAPAFLGQECFLGVSRDSHQNWKWPYSVWCALYAEICLVPLTGLLDVLDDFPILRPLYRAFSMEKLQEVANGENPSEEDFFARVRAQLEAESHMDRMHTPQENLGGGSSPLCGTWEYLCGQREYNVSEQKGVLIWSQTDPNKANGTGKFVTGTLQRVRGSKGEVYEAALSNRGRISLYFYSAVDKATNQKEDHVESRYMQPGSRRWSHPVHAVRVNREVNELKDMHRRNQLHREMRKLQKQMGVILDNMGEMCKADGTWRVHASRKGGKGLSAADLARSSIVNGQGNSRTSLAASVKRQTTKGEKDKKQDEPRLPGQPDFTVK